MSPRGTRHAVPWSGWWSCSCWRWPIGPPFDRGLRTRLPTFQSRSRTWPSFRAVTTIGNIRPRIEVRIQPSGDGYGQLRVARPGDTMRLQAFPDVEIAVSDILR